MPRKKDGGGFSGPLSAIAVAGIALGVVVMVVAVSILRGFQGEMADKVSGFGSHITVTAFSSRTANYQENPMADDSALKARIEATPGVRHVGRYATKGGMVKTADQIHGIVLRGMGSEWDTSFFASNLKEGHLPRVGDADGTNDVLISTTLASRLRLAVGDKMRTYFWQGESYRSRALTVCGLYKTDLAEMDEVYVIGDLRQVQRLNDWGDTLVGGYELLVDDFRRLDATAQRVLDALPYDLAMQTVTAANPALFAWLDLLNSNITLILTIMCIVCITAIVSALLIMIFEKSQTIGILKTLGASNASIRKIFLLKATRLIAEGIAAGVAIGLVFCLVQKRWAPLKLDAESYSMSVVPIDVDPWIFILVAVVTAVACVAALLLPAAWVSRISPASTVRMEK